MDNMLTWLSRRVKGCHSQVDHNRLKKGQPANNIFIVCHERVVTQTQLSSTQTRLIMRSVNRSNRKLPALIMI